MVGTFLGLMYQERNREVVWKSTIFLKWLHWPDVAESALLDKPMSQSQRKYHDHFRGTWLDFVVQHQV